LANTATFVKCLSHLVDDRHQRGEHLVDAPKKNGPPSVAIAAACSAGNVKRRSGWIVFNISGGDHAA